jgi:aminopeptidase N
MSCAQSLSFADFPHFVCSFFSPVHLQSRPLTPPDPKPNGRRRTGRARCVDLKHQVIDLKFDWAKKQAFGTTTITLAAFQPTDRIMLDAGNLTINLVTLSDGAPLTFHYDGGDRDNGLEIKLDRVYPAQTDLTVRISYRTNWVNQTDPNNLWGSFGKGLRFLVPTSNDPDLPRQIWSCGRNGGNRHWVPGYDAPNELVTTEFIATVEKSLTAISGGVLISRKDNSDGT